MNEQAPPLPAGGTPSAVTPSTVTPSTVIPSTGTPSAGTPSGSKPILFLHIPKTAGTSFLTTLHNLFGERRVIRLDGHNPQVRQEIDTLVRTRLGGLSCVAGHLPIHYFHPYLAQFQAFTILRNPVARVLSLFRFLQRASEEELKRIGLAPRFSFDAFIESSAPGLYGQTNDGMCRLLCGDPRVNDPNTPEFTRVAELPEVLEQAMQTLAGLDFGIVENMAGTREVVRAAWKIPYELDEYVKNTTERGGSEDSILNIRRIVQRNTMDIALYEKASALFAERLRDWRPPAETHHTGAVFAPKLGQTTVVADIAGRQGFHDFERVGFAWLMSDVPPRIHFTPSPTARRVRLRLYAISNDYPMADVALLVNGRRVAHRVVERKERWNTVELDLPPGLDAINRLAIEPPYWVPTRFLTPDGRDDRLLALALADVTFLA
jgi:hypothetical protein